MTLPWWTGRTYREGSYLDLQNDDEGAEMKGAETRAPLGWQAGRARVRSETTAESSGRQHQ